MGRAFACVVLVVGPLAAQGPPADGFPMPPGAVHRFGDRHARHPDGINAVAVSPDGKLLATAGANTVIVWDVKTMAARCVLRDQPLMQGYFDASGGIAFLPDSRRLLVGVGPGNNFVFDDGRARKMDVARVFDVETGKPAFAIKGPLDFGSSVWVPAGGKEVVVCTTQKITYYSAADGKEVRSVPTGNAYRGALAVAPAANLVALRYERGNESFALFDAGTGKMVFDVPAPQVGRVALSADGKRLAYVTNTDQTVHIHDVAGNTELLTFKLPATAGAAALEFSADRQTLFIGGGGGTIYRWDLKANKKLPNVGNHSSWNLTNLALSPDESVLYSTGFDRVVRRWDLKANKQIPLPDGYVTQTATVPLIDRKTLLIADHRGAIDLWDLGTGKRTKRVQEPKPKSGIDTVAVSADGRWLACGRTTQDVAVWDLQAGKQVKVIRLGSAEDRNPDDHVKRVAFSADGAVLFAATEQTGVSAFDRATGKRLWHVQEHGPWLAVDPKGRWVATATSEDREQVQWVLVNARTGAVVRRLDVTQEPEQPGQVQNFEFPPNVTDLAFTPDGSRLLTAHQDGRVRVWNPETAVEVGRLTGTGNEHASLAVSADGRWVAVGQANYKITVWELASQKLLATIAGHDSEVRDVAFTRDGRGVIGNADLAPVLWTLEVGDAPKADPGAWDVLTTDDGAKAFRTQWALVRDPAAAVKLLGEKVKPAELALDRAQFAKWVADLDSPRFRVREAAERDLGRAGLRVPIGWVRQALLDSTADEPRARLMRVLAERDKPDPREWRLARAIQVLELAGTPEAVALLKSWAAVDGSSVAESAREALARLK
jgi:WD40 repeat protein